MQNEQSIYTWMRGYLTKLGNGSAEADAINVNIPPCAEHEPLVLSRFVFLSVK